MSKDEAMRKSLAIAVCAVLVGLNGEAAAAGKKKAEATQPVAESTPGNTVTLHVTPEHASSLMNRYHQQRAEERAAEERARASEVRRAGPLPCPPVTEAQKRAAIQRVLSRRTRPGPRRVSIADPALAPAGRLVVTHRPPQAAPDADQQGMLDAEPRDELSAAPQDAPDAESEASPPSSDRAANTVRQLAQQQEEQRRRQEEQRRRQEEHQRDVEHLMRLLAEQQTASEPGNCQALSTEEEREVEQLLRLHQQAMDSSGSSR